MKRTFLLFICGCTSASGSAQFQLPSFEPIAPMMEYREGHVMGTVPDGVLAIGGFDGTATTASCEFYHTGDGLWTSVADLPAPRQDATAPALFENRVFVIGGWDGGATYYDDILQYDMDTDTWTPVATMSSGRAGHSSVLLSPPSILICGGYDGTQDLNSCDLFNTLTYEITPTASLAVARSSFALVASPATEAEAIAIGGFNPDEGFQLASTEVWDGTEWTPGPDLPYAADNLSAVWAESPDVVVVTGGRIYNAAENVFEGVAGGAFFGDGDTEWTAFELAHPHSYHVMGLHYFGGTFADAGFYVEGGVDQTGAGLSPTPSASEYGSTYDASLGPLDVEFVALPNPMTGRFRAAIAPNDTWWYVTGGDAEGIGTAYRVQLDHPAAVDSPAAAANSLAAFPNPAVGLTGILGLEATDRWALFDASGKQVHAGTGPSIDVGPLPTGQYMLQAGDGRVVRIVRSE